jgi:fatty acid desaturase
MIRLLLAPYWVNFNLEHHLFMFAPCWRLPAAHRLLVDGRRGRRMEFKPGYLAVLRAATSRLADSPRGAGARSTTQHI